MKGSRIAAIAIVGIMIASGFCFLTFNSSNAKAFPTANPQPSEYIFYDDFEGTGTLGYPTWNANQVYTITYSTDYAYHGVKSAKFAAHDYNSRQILRGFSNDTDPKNEGIIVECMFRDNASITSTVPEVKAQLWLANSANSWIGLGIALNTSLGQRLFSYWDSDGGGAYEYQSTGIERTTGWHNLKIMIVSHTSYFCYVDDEFVGNITLADSTGMEWYGFNLVGPNPDVAGEFYVDQFLVYEFWQDQVWRRASLAVNDNQTWNSYLAIEPSILYESGVWKMWYDGINISATNIGTLCYATSTDGYNWTDYPSNPIVSFGTGYRPFVTKIGSTYYCYNTYEAGSYAAKHYKVRTSADGITWNAAVDTNLGCGAIEGDWDHTLLGNIAVWKEEATWYALYEAASNSTFWRTGLATSTDGITWAKNAANPVTPDDMVAGGPDIHKYGSTYYLLCHGLLTNWVNNKPTDLYLLQSTDLVNWEPSTFFSQMTRLIGSNLELPQIADAAYYSADGKNLMAYEGTIDGTDEGRIWIAQSDYTLQEIAQGEILQWGTHLIGDIGVRNNVTAAGTYWYSGINAMKGTYTDNLSLTTTSPINVTLTEMNNVSTSWIADSGTGNPTVQYEVSNLTAGTTYYILVDGTQYGLPQIPINGSISFAYSGGYHQFDVTVYRFGPTLSPLLYLIPLFLTLGIVMIPLMKVVELSKQKRMLRVDEVVRMVVTIIVGFALVGITYLMI